MAPVPKKLRVPPKLGAHFKEKVDAHAQLKADVLKHSDDVFDRYVYGESFQAISESLPFKIQGWKLRDMLMSMDETKETYARSGILRSHNLIDASIDYGRKAASIGDAAGLRVAVDTNMKVAAKLNAFDYGDKSKLELTGKNGGALEIKADLTLTAEQAFERMVKGM